MSIQKFSLEIQGKEPVAKVLARNIAISRKISREIAAFIKGKNVDRAINELNLVAEGKLAVPYKRYNKDVPHRKGMAAGRFPRKASLEIVKILNSLRSNAETLGLNTDHLEIVHASAQHGSLTWHYGRHRRRRRKMCHFELIGMEKEPEVKKKKPKKEKAPEPKEEKKVEEQPKEEKKEEPKKEEKPKEKPKKEVKPLEGIKKLEPEPKKEKK